MTKLSISPFILDDLLSIHKWSESSPNPENFASDRVIFDLKVTLDGVTYKFYEDMIEEIE